MTAKVVTKSDDRVYAVLHRNPRLTAVEVHRHLPDMSLQAVRCAIYRLAREGRLKRVGKNVVRRAYGMRATSSTAYSVCYKKREKEVAPAPEPVLELTPEMEVKEAPVAPQPEREVLILRHLSNLYKAVAEVAEGNDKLIALLRDTLTDLAETKAELEQERQRRNWWDKLKGWFA